LIELRRGESYTWRDITVTATFARHEEPGVLAEDAVGYLVILGGVTLWHAGDTDHDARLRSLADAGIDAAFLPINGGRSNMNAYEAALLAWELKAKLAIPMRCGMWPDDEYGASFGPATLDPAIFEKTYRKLGGDGDIATLHVGELVLFVPGAGTVWIERV
jgi:L-ascorbate metabolism protein UlaG (beta-lactamase superfamily)